MNAIEEARRIITANPDSEESLSLARLVLALESDIDFPLSSLYTLNLDTFNLALEILT